MRNTLVRLVRLAAGYSLVTLLGPLFTVFLTPIYTRVLTPADYGVVDVALTLSGFVGLFALLGADQALSAHFFDGDHQHQRNLVTTTSLYVGALGLMLGLGLLILAEPLATTLWGNPERRFLVQLLAVNAVSTPLYAVLLAALRLRQSVRRVNALGLALLVSTALSNLLMLFVFQLRGTGIVIANVVTNSGVCALALALAWRPLRGHFTTAMIKPILASGTSLVPGALGYLALSNADRLLLTQYVSQTDLGYYSLANKFASLLYVLLSAVWTAWWPMALEMSGRNEAPRQFARMAEYFGMAALGLSLSLGLFAPEVLGLFAGPAFVAAAPVAAFLLVYFGPLGFALIGPFQVGLFARKKTAAASIAYLIAAAVNVGLNVILDPGLGIWGATVATLVAGVVLAIGLYLPSQRYYPVPYRWERLLALALYQAAVLSAIVAWPNFRTLWPLKGAIVAGFVVIVLATGLITPRQLSQALLAARPALERLLGWPEHTR